MNNIIKSLKNEAARVLLLIFFMPLATNLLAAGVHPKREFRGAWIQCVNGQFQNLSTDEMQRTLSYQLDELQKDGVNAIIFQVRAECDALYPYWDPLQWMIDQCHRRGMELHAWINPYRAKTKGQRQRLHRLWLRTISPAPIPEVCSSTTDCISLTPDFPKIVIISAR